MAIYIWYVGNNQETIDDFYSNKKGSERYVLRNTDGVNNTPEGAHNPDPEPSAKVEDKSESPKLFGAIVIFYRYRFYCNNIFTTSAPDFTKYAPAGNVTLTLPDPECTKVPDIE